MSELALLEWTIVGAVSARGTAAVKRQKKRQEEARRAQHLERVRETTRRYRDRYRETYQDLLAQGLDRFLPQEFAQVKQQLDELDRLLVHDPLAARDLSLQLAPTISRLPARARQARRENEEERRRQEERLAQLRAEATSELGRFLEQAIAQITDPVEQDLVLEQLQALRHEFAGRSVLPEELPAIQREITEKIRHLRAQAARRAQEWREAKARQMEDEARRKLLDLYTAELAKQPNQLQAQQKRERLENLYKLAQSQGLSLEEFQACVLAETESTESAPYGEEARRQAVRAIVESLNRSGFIVDQPRRIPETDEVLIRAKKPAGAEASFSIRLNGTMIYKFDHYEGMKCRDDIDKVLALLEQVYGIQLSDARLLWQNPDRLSKSARPLDWNQRRESHG
jgi:uncharacterized protein YecA (UPF0149 family)